MLVHVKDYSEDHALHQNKMTPNHHVMKLHKIKQHHYTVRGHHVVEEHYVVEGYRVVEGIMSSSGKRWYSAPRHKLPKALS